MIKDHRHFERSALLTLKYSVFVLMEALLFALRLIVGLALLKQPLENFFKSKISINFYFTRLIYLFLVNIRL